MKKLFILYAIFITFATKAQSVGINTDGSNANASAMLDVSSTSKGFLPPRMTDAERTAIASPSAGLMVWCTNCGTSGEMQYFNGTVWIASVLVPGSFAKPDAPTSPIATAGNAQASVAFTAPIYNGGSAITGYTVTSSPGSFTASGASSPINVTGLSNGIAYTFTVVATNSVGNSVASTASAAVVPKTVPGAPTSPVATLGNAQASVAFTPPTSNGGSAITGYTVTSTPGGYTATGASSPIIVTGLTNETSYTFTVIAINAVGNSVASVASGAVTPTACFANVSGTVKRFMCYNLGVTGSQDPLSHQGGANNGALYQWGRKTDGHEVRTSSTLAGPLAGAVASRFITNSSTPYDWISPQDGTRWLDASKTANDPCPSGFRVPTQAQWGGLFRNGTPSGAPNTATRNTWTWTGNGFTVGANLFLPAAGTRYVSDASLNSVGTNGYYWSSTVSGTFAYYLNFTSGNVYPGSILNRGLGSSVRCISE